ncbi:hypothetical protein K8I61_18060 [bacterium]|nr:hypothetical protein [bacterium]
MKRVMLGVAVLFVMALAVAAYAGGSLDGKTYEITMPGEDGKPAPDTLEFMAGKLHSTECDKYGFKAEAYTAKSMGPATDFTSTAMNDKGGKNEWKGKVVGDTISGTLVYTETGKDPQTMPFSGKLKK